MKSFKKALCFATAGLTALSLTACFGGGTSNVTFNDDPDDEIEYDIDEDYDDEDYDQDYDDEDYDDNYDDEDYDDEEPSEGAPDYDEQQQFDPLFVGIFTCDQYSATIETMGDGSWVEYNTAGEVVENGYFNQTDAETIVLYNGDGETYKTLNMITGGLFDEFEQVSYSKVTDHPDANTSGYEPGMLWGIWDYQERDIEDTEGESFYSVGTFTIDRKGNFTYESYNGETIEGTITIDYDYYDEDTEAVPYYSFVSNDKSFSISCYCSQNDPDIYYEGNGGMSRLVRQN